MTKIQSAAVPAAFLLLTSIGLGYGALAPQSKPGDDKPKPEPKAAAVVDEPQSADSLPRPTRHEYIVDSPDLLLIEVLEALPGRPISGERLVRPDGTISLGFYGDVEVAGLTRSEIKEKVVNHLRKYLSDKTLGLVTDEDLRSREKTDAKPREPKDTDSVFVDITAYNSQFYYLSGEFEAPGKFPVTGRDNVLDAVYMASGLTPRSDRSLTLVRKGPKGAPAKRYLVDFDAILSGDDPSTNYYLQPGDRLIATRAPQPAPPRDPELDQAAPRAAAGEAKLLEVDRRLGRIEGQLAEILKRLDGR